MHGLVMGMGIETHCLLEGGYHHQGRRLIQGNKRNVHSDFVKIIERDEGKEGRWEISN